MSPKNQFDDECEDVSGYANFRNARNVVIVALDLPCEMHGEGILISIYVYSCQVLQIINLFNSRFLEIQLVCDRRTNGRT